MNDWYISISWVNGETPSLALLESENEDRELKEYNVNQAVITKNHFLLSLTGVVWGGEDESRTACADGSAKRLRAWQNQPDLWLPNNLSQQYAYSSTRVYDLLVQTRRY